jgi:hypothetical protein
MTTMNRNEVKIGSPCSLDWRKMTPAEGGRFCGDCKKVVRDLSSMTEREARALLKREANGELCVRYILDERGRIFFGADAPRRDRGWDVLPSQFLNRARRLAAAALVATALPMATQACMGAAEYQGDQNQDDQDQNPSVAQREDVDAASTPTPPPTTQPASPVVADHEADGGADPDASADASTSD